MLVSITKVYSNRIPQPAKALRLLALSKNNEIVEKYAYDPWGNRRNPTDWSLADMQTSRITSRGYTLHEHLDGFGVINMNGRVYDPMLSRPKP